jgi:uncharacterized protein YndB with AHSA1/START domain
MPRSTDKVAGIGSVAVQAKTGKGWAAWFKVLDQHGCRKMKHKEIAALLHDELGCPSWWSQMVANGYEQFHGLRQKHETPSGYQISRSKTLPVPAAKLFAAWFDPKGRRHWLMDSGITIRKATPNKSLRITWVDGKTNVEVHFYPKGADKCQVVVQHDKLPSAKAGERMKAYWNTALERLGDALAR